MEKTNRKHLSVSVNEILIIIALVFSPFTALRFSFFGITEVLFIIFCGLYIYRRNGILSISNNSAGIYYMAFVLVTLVGWGYNYVSGINSGTTQSALFNLASYVISGGSIICVESFLQEEDTDIRPGFILKMLYWYLGIISIVLYMISLRRSSIFGYSLKYYQYFCPLANNLHQYAMVILPLPFLGLYNMSLEQSRIKKIAYFGMSIALSYLAYSTGSEKAIIGLVAGGLVLLFLYVLTNISDSYKRHAFCLICIFWGVSYILLFHERVFSSAIDFFTEIDGNGSRQHLYLSAVKTILTKSPILGLGPSVHVTIRSGELYDAHETFLAAGLSGGFIGIALIMAFMIIIAKKAINSCFLFSAMVPIIIYALGGDLLRKLPVWIIFILLAYTAEEETCPLSIPIKIKRKYVLY